MSGDKQRISASIDADIKDQLDTENNLNKSAVVNELLRQYLVQGDAAEAGLQRRLKEKEQTKERKELERQRLENEIESLEREIDDIQNQIQQRRQEGLDEILEMAEKIRNNEFPRENLTADNPAVENYAQKAAMTPERFVRKVEDEL
jgi:polyhydroxyalkanoate synthesis regulator phasin